MCSAITVPLLILIIIIDTLLRISHVDLKTVNGFNRYLQHWLVNFPVLIVDAPFTEELWTPSKFLSEIGHRYVDVRDSRYIEREPKAMSIEAFMAGFENLECRF